MTISRPPPGSAAFFALELWNDMGCADAERSAFKPMQVTEDGFTDELLRQHTQEADNLGAKHETMKHILEVRHAGRCLTS